MDASTALLTVGVVVGSTEAKRITHGQMFTMKPVLGGFMVGIFLLILGNANDHLANLVALLIVVGAVLTNGIPILSKK
jgi:hypothetical protein